MKKYLIIDENGQHFLKLNDGQYLPVSKIEDYDGYIVEEYDESLVLMKDNSSYITINTL